MKRVNFIFFLGLFLLLCSTGEAQIQKSFKISSPDKGTRMEVGLSSGGQLLYRVFFSGKEVTSWSQLGFVINGVSAGEKTVVKEKTQSSVREKFAWPLGENDTIGNYYNEMNLACQSGPFNFGLDVRVFDGSVAFRYQFSEQKEFEKGIITHENTEFNFPASYTIYQYHHESVFTPVSIDSLTTPCDLPATLCNRQFYLSIGEAANDNYTKAELSKGKAIHSLSIDLLRDPDVNAIGAFHTPWRTISISKTAIGLHAFSELSLKLNPPSREGIPGWIKPGKLIRSQLNTQSGMDCIDFCVKNNFQYIMFDGGWYGPDHRPSSHPEYAIPAIDLPKVIQYGKEKGIGVILYVDYAELRAKLDSLLPLYKKWGISGLKFGFVDGFTQDGIIWLASAIKKVYSYGLILNIHDNYKPTGLSRTFPSLLTQEGIRGDENSPDAFHTTVLPFTRFIAGAADFTFCYPNLTSSYSKNLKVSMGQQLALTTIYFSPLQAMFWYGKPGDYTNEKEIEFFKLVPVTWNESRYLAGEIGKNISVARRNGTTWFIGNAAGLMDWNGRIKFDFLTKGKKYVATIYEDDGNGSIKKSIKEVMKDEIFPIALHAKTGHAIIISVKK